MRITSTHVAASALVSQNDHVQDCSLQWGSDSILQSQQVTPCHEFQSIIAAFSPHPPSVVFHHLNTLIATLRSFCASLPVGKWPKRSVVGNPEFNTSSILDFHLAFGQSAEALLDFTDISLMLSWLHDSPFFLYPPTPLLSALPVSVLNLLCNEVTQGLGTSPGTNHQGLSASCDGQTRGSDFTTPGTNKHRATAAALARMKKATRLHVSAQHWGGSEWGQIFHSIARGPSYGKFQSVKAKCYWNVAFLQLAWNFLLLLNLEKQVWKIHPFPHGACS